VNEESPYTEPERAFKWFRSWFEPSAMVGLILALLSIGALYQRVSTLEANDADQRKWGEHIAAMDSTLAHIDHQLDQIESKIDRQH
jgi:hypothetical protein